MRRPARSSKQPRRGDRRLRRGALRVTQLQKPGGKRLPAREFLAGSPLAAGQRFALPDAA
jgi:hypothetical protein